MEIGEDVLKSFMQKAIRRGMAKEALWCAVKLYEKSWYMLVHRLRVIVCEDIGDVPIGTHVMQILDWVERCLVKKWEPDLCWLGKVIVLLCRAQKSREGDEAINHVLREMRNGWTPQIPEWVYDMHTRAGKGSMKEQIRRFWEEGALLEMVPEGYDYGWVPYLPEQGDGYHDAHGRKVPAPSIKKGEAQGTLL